LNAALISIITEWLSDLKLGYCSDGWWLNRDFCCWELDDSESGCANWHVWSPTSVGRWFVYVLFAVVFSYIAAYLVRVFARYAAGSGISEIKVIIGGFVMKGYLGGWTLLIKSITLVCGVVLVSPTLTYFPAIRDRFRSLGWKRRSIGACRLLYW
jgi:chloride channel 3/4/5